MQDCGGVCYNGTSKNRGGECCVKRGLLLMICLFLLVLAGCTAVNQTNTFVELPPAGTPEAAATPELTKPPEITQPPVVEPDVQPTDTPDVTSSLSPGATDTPAPTEAPTPTPTQEPEGSPGGFNG